MAWVDPFAALNDDVDAITTTTTTKDFKQKLVALEASAKFVTLTPMVKPVLNSLLCNAVKAV